MEHLWVLFVVIYSILKGTRDAMKKQALKSSSLYEVLFFYTLIGLLLSLPFSLDAFSLAPKYILLVFIKSAVVCTAWFFSCMALKKMSVSLYGIMDLSRMVFSTLMGVFLLHEAFTAAKGIGVTLVIIGLLLVNMKKQGDVKGASLPVLLAALGNCFFNAVSGVMDKVLMRYMTSSQLQLWFMLFMTLIYGAVLIIKHEKIVFSHIKTNYWIVLMSLSLIIGDKILFEANASPYSEVTVMTVIKQSSVIVSVLLGWLVFKEKNIFFKLICCSIVLSGILVSVYG